MHTFLAKAIASILTFASLVTGGHVRFGGLSGGAINNPPSTSSGLQAANNLSDVASTTASVSNLSGGLGSATQVWTSNGTGKLPTWQAASGGTFTTTTFNGLSTTAYTISPSSTVGVATTSPGTIGLGAKFYPIQWLIENPSASENDSHFITRATSTINSCYAVNKTIGDTVTFGLGYSTSRATATSSLTQIVSATTTTVTATTTPATITLSGTPTPGAQNPLIFYTTSASSTQFTLTCYYTEN